MDLPIASVGIASVTEAITIHLRMLLEHLDVRIEETPIAALGSARPVPQADLWLLIANDEQSLIEAADRLVCDKQLHLSVLRTESGAHVGPTYIEPGTACAHCLSQRLLSNSASPRPIEESSDRGIEDALWKVVVHRELSALRTGGLPILTINHYLDCDGLNARIERHRILRAPRCATCRQATQPPYSAWQLKRV